jgi:hypothetical protein
MRRKHLARLGRAPANCNRRESPDLGALARDSGATPVAPPVEAGDAVEAGDDAEATAPDRPGFHGGVPCASCARKAATARQHQDRQLWILARELCASASLYGLGGREPVAERTLRLAFTMLRDRVGTFEAGAGRD